MNERIRELELQAYIEVTRPWRDPSSGYVHDMTYKEFSREKFAELIVRECVSIVAKRKDIAIDGGWNVDEAMSMAAMDLEEYLGVE